MIKLIISAFILGLILSLFLIGPVFFIVLETSLLYGSTAAIILNLGVILSDITCIIIAYFSSINISRYLANNQYIYKICAFIILLYGVLISIKKHNSNNNNNNNICLSNNYLKLFFKGFFLNLINISVILFWISIVLFISIIYNNIYKFILYIFILLLTSFCIDLFKIFLGRKIYYKFNKKLLLNNNIKKFIGISLIIFGIFLFIKSFFHWSLLEPNNKLNFLY